MGKLFASIISLIVTSLCYFDSIHALSPVVMIPGLAGSVIKAKLENAYVVVFSPPLENDSSHKNKTATLHTFGVQKMRIGL